MDNSCRVSVEEERHDRKDSERQKRINALFIEKREQYKHVTHGEIAEACEFFADMDGGDRLERAFAEGDCMTMGMLLKAAVESWISLQASKEVGRMIDRGDV